MKFLYPILLLSILLLNSCAKDKTYVPPGDITYPEYADGKLNVLGTDSDTIYVNHQNGLDFSIAADVPSRRSIRVVCRPEYGTFWNGFGLNSSQSNPHLEWVFHNNFIDINSIEDEFFEDRLCKTQGIFGPFNSSAPSEPNVTIEVLVYEDQSEEITRCVYLVPI